MITLTADLTPFQRDIRALGDRAPLAAARALNRSLASVQTSAVRALAEDLNIAQKFVRQAMQIHSASRQHLRAELEVTGRRLPLFAFGATGPRPSRGRGAGVRYNLGRGRGVAASAFLLTVASAAQAALGLTGHTGVFARADVLKRKSPGAWSFNLPILELFGPSLPRVFTRRRIAQACEALALDLFTKNFQHEVSFLMRGR